MDAFELLLKAAVPPPAKGKKKNDKDAKGGDCPGKDAAGGDDGAPSAETKGGAAESQEAEGDQPEGDGDSPFGAEEGGGDLTPEEEAAMNGEGEELPAEEGMPMEEGMDDGGQAEMSDLIGQLAEAEQTFYATKGQHGGGHHNTDAALEDMHKLVRKLAKKVAGQHGLEKDGSMPEPDPMAMQAGGDPNGGSLPEEMTRSLSPGLHKHVLTQALRIQQDGHFHFTLDKSTAARPKPTPPKEGQSVPQHFKPAPHYANMNTEHLTVPGVSRGAMPSGKMGPSDATEISMANYVGDPNGGAFLNWDGIMVGRMGTTPAKAGDDGMPSVIYEQDGRATITGAGKLPGSGGGITGANPYQGSDAGTATPVRMPGGMGGGTAPMSPPAAKMTPGGDWIDWGAYDGGDRTMPFAGELRGMMNEKRQGTAPMSPPAPMHGKATLLAMQERPRAPQAPLPPRRPGPGRVPPRMPAPRGSMTGHQSRPRAPQAPFPPRRPGSGRVPPRIPEPRMSAKQQRPRAPQVPLPPRRPGSGRVPPRIPEPAARMSYLPDTPGVPLHVTEAAMSAQMSAGYEAPSAPTGFDYAMIGRMQRMEAGLPAIETMERSMPAPEALVSDDIDFGFLLDMSADFLAKSEELLALLEE